MALVACPEADQTFGPVVKDCRRAFDFTLLFEAVFCMLLPACIFTAAAVVRLLGIGRARGSKDIAYAKLHDRASVMALAAYVGLELASLVLIARHRVTTTRASVPAAVASLTASLAAAGLSRREKALCACPSVLLGWFLCINILLKAVVARTYWLIQPYSSIACITLALVAVQIIVLLLEECAAAFPPKRHTAIRTKEESAGFLGLSLLTWLNALLWAGYRRLLQEADLKAISQCTEESRNGNEHSALEIFHKCKAESCREPRYRHC